MTDLWYNNYSATSPIIKENDFMFNWIFKKIASYVPVQTIDYAKLAEALNINDLANQVVISEEVIAEKIAEKFPASDVAPYINIKK